MAGARLFCFAMQRGREAPAENSRAPAIAAPPRLLQSPSREGRACAAAEGERGRPAERLRVPASPGRSEKGQAIRCQELAAKRADHGTPPQCHEVAVEVSMLRLKRYDLDAKR